MPREPLAPTLGCDKCSVGAVWCWHPKPKLAKGLMEASEAQGVGQGYVAC